jgi:CDP-glucose 4,6-dehydratase
VLEPLSGYLWLGSQLSNKEVSNRLSGESFNFGPKEEVVQSVAELITELAKFLPDVKWETPQQDGSKAESNLLKLNCDKALSLLAWKAMLTFEETVEMTALWYKKYYQNNNDMLDFSKNQIRQYCQLAKKRRLGWIEQN